MTLLKKIIFKYRNLSKPAKASLWFTSCYIIQRGLQFICMPIYTRVMSTAEYGVYSVFLSWFNIISVFTSLSIYNGTFNNAMVKYEDARDKYISSIQYLTAIIAVIFALILLPLHSYICEWTGYGLKFQILLYIHLLLFPTLQYWFQKQRFLFEYKKLVIITIINSAASLLLGIVVVLISEDKSFALVAVSVIVQAIINTILFYSLARTGKCFYRKEYWNWSTKMAIPLIPHYLSEILLGHADRLMINQMCGPGPAGIYNIVYQISMVMTILRAGINGSFTPWLYYSLKEKKYNAIRKVTNLITLMMWILTLLFMLVGPELLKIVAPATYYEAVVDIPAIMIGCFFIFVYVLFLNVEIYYEQNRFVALASIIAALLNVVLNYVCILYFGYLAAGYTTMISYMVMAILHFLFLKRIMRKNEELKQVFDFKFILVASIILVILGRLLIELYNYAAFRWGIIFVIVIIIFAKKSVINNMLDLLKNRG